MNVEIDRSIISDEQFWNNSNSLQTFLHYCYEEHYNLDIHLEKMGSSSFSLKILANGNEDMFRKDTLVEELLGNNSLSHPFLVFVSELCNPSWVTAFVDNSQSGDDYRVRITPYVDETEISYLQNEPCEFSLEYSVAFDSGVSRVWDTIHMFLDSTDESRVCYRVSNRTDDHTELNWVQ